LQWLLRQADIARFGLKSVRMTWFLRLLLPPRP
jgi:hypothetical protein